MNRPEGQPGTVRAAFTYPAVQHPDGVTVDYFRDHPDRWVRASPYLAATFEPGPEWQADCDHEGLVPWKGCDVEADCLALRREDAARERAER